VLIILALLIIAGYILGTPSEARAASPKCTQADPCTAKEAALLKRLGQIGRVADTSGEIKRIGAGDVSCKTRYIKRTMHSQAGPALMWATMSKTWCFRKNGLITFTPKAKIQTGVTRFGNAIGYHDVEVVGDPIEQRYPWHGDIRRGSWSWRSLKSKQQVPIINVGIFQLQTASFAISIRAHGDGTATDNGNDTP
jgi:hypothetical protein